MFHRILVPVDGTTGSERAVPYALGLAKSLGAEAIICHVITTPVATNSSSERRDADQYTTKIAQRFRSAGVSVKTQVRRGDAPAEIKKAAVDWNVDAIVMATRSRRRLEKLMLGSVADIVVSDSRLPVLLVSSRRKLKKVGERIASTPPVEVQAKSVNRVLRRLAAQPEAPQI